MSAQSYPYKFEYVKDMQPLRVSVERKVIYVNEDALMEVIRKLVRNGLDWKQVMKKNIRHEKAHEKYFKWNLKWGVGARQYGWLASYLTDIVIDKLHFGNDSDHQKWLIADSRHAFKDIKKDLSTTFRTLESRPHFLYNQAAYWITIGAITLDEAVSLYAEKTIYIMEMSQLFSKIKKEEDLDWAFAQARIIYFENFK
jgi:hypothetical protein